MIKLNGLPMNIPVVDTEGSLEKIWEKALGDIGDSLNGTWGEVATGDIVESGITYGTADYSLQVLGRIIVVSIVFTNLDSTNGSLDLSSLRFNPSPTILSTYTGNNWTISDGIYIDSAIVNLPDTVGSNLAITGTLIRN